MHNCIRRILLDINLERTGLGTRLEHLVNTLNVYDKDVLFLLTHIYTGT